MARLSAEHHYKSGTPCSKYRHDLKEHIFPLRASSDRVFAIAGGRNSALDDGVLILAVTSILLDIRLLSVWRRSLTPLQVVYLISPSLSSAVAVVVARSSSS
jgi:hypothetical protein